ncbi:hypothetical protein H1R20_g12013, partial [Candolleomyces eurysporus]
MPESSFTKKGASSASEPKTRGANRSTKVAGKLKVLPEQPENLPGLDSKAKGQTADKVHTESTGTTGESEEGDADTNEESQEEEVEIYNQISLIPEGTARRDALRLTKKKAKSLPRVTAYATASSYRMNDLMRFFLARKGAYHTNPKLIDDVIYTPYVYDPPAISLDPPKLVPTSHAPTGDLLGIPEFREVGGEERPTKKAKSKFDTAASGAEIFMFSYGTVVIWGMTEAQEKRFLSSMSVRFSIAD